MENLVLAPVVTAVIQTIKEAVPKKYLPVVAIVVWFVLTWIVSLSSTQYIPFSDVLINWIMVWFAASGLYAGGKTILKK